jgi:hypothetical protein
MNRKWLIRAAVSIAVCAASLLIAAPVLAPWGWCDEDPVLNINGYKVNLDAAYQGDPSLVSGMEFHVNAPAGTQISLLACDPGATITINFNNGNGNQGIKVSVEFNTGEEYAATLTVSVAGTPVNQVAGNTQEGLATSFNVP